MTAADHAAEALDAVPDLTLGECCSRWGVKSRNAIKARANRLGVELQVDTTTRRSIWPAEHLHLGDALHDHLQDGGTMADYAGPSLTPSAAVTDKPARPARVSSVTPSPAVTDAMLALLQALPLQPVASPPDPLAVHRGLAEAAELGAWLNSRELAALLQLAPGTVRGWADGACPRPGFRLERRTHRGVWWRVVTDT